MSSQIELVPASHTGTGRLTRMPVICVASATVNALLGMICASGVVPVSTWTRADADAVVGINETMTTATRMNRRFTSAPLTKGASHLGRAFSSERSGWRKYPIGLVQLHRGEDSVARLPWRRLAWTPSPSNLHWPSRRPCREPATCSDLLMKMPTLGTVLMSCSYELPD